MTTLANFGLVSLDLDLDLAFALNSMGQIKWEWLYTCDRQLLRGLDGDNVYRRGWHG